jgi:hypothetical protein
MDCRFEQTLNSCLDSRLITYVQSLVNSPSARTGDTIASAHASADVTIKFTATNKHANKGALTEIKNVKNKSAVTARPRVTDGGTTPVNAG